LRGYGADIDAINGEGRNPPAPLPTGLPQESQASDPKELSPYRPHIKSLAIRRSLRNIDKYKSIPYSEAPS